jgi:hypothetical protein
MMSEKDRRRWQLSRTEPGDGSRLHRFRFQRLMSGRGGLVVLTTRA